MIQRKTASRPIKPATNGELDTLWHQFETSHALPAHNELAQIGRTLCEAEGRRTVRTGLFMLTQSGRELLDRMHSDPELVDVHSELAECARDHATRLRGVADALEAASMRLKLALCDAGRAGAA